MADAGHALRDGDACQRVAALERIGADAGHALRDGDACQRVAVPKRRIVDNDYIGANLNRLHHIAIHSTIVTSTAQHTIRIGVSSQTKRASIYRVKRNRIITDTCVCVRCIHVACSRKCFCCASIAPVNRYAICYRLRDIQRHVHPAICGDADIKPGLAVICDVHSAHVHGPGQSVDLLQRPIPPLEHKAVMGGAVRQSGKGLCF